MLLQGNGRYNCNCIMQRSIIVNFIIMNELKLEYVVSVRNARGYSTYNFVERNISSIIFGLQAIAYNREEALEEVAKALKSSKSIKAFINKNRRANLELVNNYMKCINIYIKRSNNIIS